MQDDVTQLRAQRIDVHKASREPAGNRAVQLADAGVARRMGRAAHTYIEAHEPTWRNAMHGEQWRNTLASTYPSIGDLNVRDIVLPHVLSVLEPIWRTKTETASRLRGRIVCARLGHGAGL